MVILVLFGFVSSELLLYSLCFSHGLSWMGTVSQLSSLSFMCSCKTVCTRLSARLMSV